MSEFYKYVNLIKANTPYAKRMKFLSNKIFGEVARETNQKSMKVVKILSEEPLYKKELFVDYYPRYTELGYLMYYLRKYGLFRDEHQDFKEEMIRLRTLRGKPPKTRKRVPKSEKTLLDTKV